MDIYFVSFVFTDCVYGVDFSSFFVNLSAGKRERLESFAANTPTTATTE